MECSKGSNGVRPRQVFVSTVIGRKQDAVSISLTVNEHRRRNGLEHRKENKIKCVTTPKKTKQKKK